MALHCRWFLSRGQSNTQKTALKGGVFSAFIQIAAWVEAGGWDHKCKGEGGLAPAALWEWGWSSAHRCQGSTESGLLMQGCGTQVWAEP